jgi:hypothetical protein
MIIGNIISSNKEGDLKYINYCTSLDKCFKDIPTLIIGWSNTKKIFGEGNVSILNKSIDKTTFWTFNQKEKKIEYDIDTLTFYKFCFSNMKTRYKYVYVDPIHDSLSNIKKIIKKIKSLKNIKVYQEDDYIYIYGDNLIFGIDLNIMDFIGIDKYKLKNKIEKITNVLLSKNDIFICYNDLISEFNNDVKYITYFI